MIIASIDIGTNTVLLTVAEWDGKIARVLRDEARITRLGQGLNRDPNFLPEAQERALDVLKDYKKIADSLGASKILAVGTAAFRKAGNANAFVQRVKQEAGIDIRIISGEEEARLSYLSAAHDFGDSENLYVLDIGGGSTEVITKSAAVSMDLGAVVLSESIVTHDPPTDDELAAMEREIHRAIVGANLVSALAAPLGVAPKATFVGLAGSVTTLSAIQQALTVWDGAKVQGSTLTLPQIDDMIALFRKTTTAEKSKIPGMVKGREDTILAGTLILKAVMEAVHVTQVTVSDRGLRFGLIYESNS
ncbi:MAG TPA: Ppx/GppA phosphatase family protein [bacterium]|nr:Ppx/GppA phosphatase family protein [bacterium]